MKSKLITILIIIVIGLGVYGYFTWQDHSYSKEILKMEILAPQNASTGQDVDYIVRLKNNGDVRLDNPQLVFIYPANSIPDSGSLRVTKTTKDFGGAIYPGQEKIFKFKARLFGKKGDIEEAKAQCFFQPKGLTPNYVSKTNAITTINNVPITFETDLPSSIEAGRKLNFSLNYFSTISYPLTNLEIKAYYPNDFKFLSSIPKGIADNDWEIAGLNNTEGGRITIQGILSGEPGEDKLFKADFGIWINNEFVVLKEIQKQVSIVEPSLYIDQTINGSPDYKANLGDVLHYQIFFKNIGDKPFQHLFLVVKLNSDLYDLQTIKTDTGKNQFGDNTIVWDWHDVNELRFLDVGQEGQVEFWVNVKKKAPTGLVQPTLEDQVIVSKAKKTFVTKVNSKIELTQQAFVSDEIFGSEGPLPPKVGQDSIFTVIWRVKDYYSPIEDAKAKAVLPDNVSLTGKIMPQKLTFDSKTREIVWEVGQIQPESPTSTPTQIAFQVDLKPTPQQKGQFASLVGQTTLTGTDQWTGDSISATTTPLTTQTFGDQGKVQ